VEFMIDPMSSVESMRPAAEKVRTKRRRRRVVGEAAVVEIAFTYGVTETLENDFTVDRTCEGNVRTRLSSLSRKCKNMFNQ